MVLCHMAELPWTVVCDIYRDVPSSASNRIVYQYYIKYLPQPTKSTLYIIILYIVMLYIAY